MTRPQSNNLILKYFNFSCELDDRIEDVLMRMLQESTKLNSHISVKDFNNIISWKFKIKRQMIKKFLLEAQQQGILDLRNENIVRKKEMLICQ